MKKVIIAFAVIGATASCKKSTPAPAGCTVNATSIVGAYTISAMNYKSANSAPDVDQLTFMQDCQKDDTYELKADGSLVISEAGINCGLPPQPGLPTSWSLAENNTVLVMDVPLNIVSFDCSTLVVEERNVMIDGDVKTTTYKKQ